MKSTEGDNTHTLVSVRTTDGSRLIPCLIERSVRVRRMCLQFDCPAYVTLKLPLRSPEKCGLLFVQEHADWICSVLDSQPVARNLKQYLAKHPRLSVSGYWHRLQLQFAPLPSAWEVDDDRLSIRIVLDPESDPESQLILRLREIARIYLPNRVRFLEPRVGVKAHGITIRNQKSRWGSCSETSGLSLNWRLILVAPRLQDHVILHELAHIRHFDHSSDFHAFLMALDPHAKAHAKRLHRAGSNFILSLGR